MPPPLSPPPPPLQLPSAPPFVIRERICCCPCRCFRSLFVLKLSSFREAGGPAVALVSRRCLFSPLFCSRRGLFLPSSWPGECRSGRNPSPSTLCQAPKPAQITESPLKTHPL